jgi:hypothetical protein
LLEPEARRALDDERPDKSPVAGPCMKGLVVGQPSLPGARLSARTRSLAHVMTS